MEGTVENATLLKLWSYIHMLEKKIECLRDEVEQIHIEQNNRDLEQELESYDKEEEWP